MQIILCLECDKKSKTDFMYINEAIKYFYKLDNKIKISVVYLAGKSNYNHHKKEGEIRKLISGYKMTVDLNTVVVYCIDKDRFDSNYEDKKFLNDVEKYCKEKGYELVYFVRDIEHVFLGAQVENNLKSKEALNFIRSYKIKNVGSKKLSNKVSEMKTSNLLCVLDKYMGEYKTNR